MSTVAEEPVPVLTEAMLRRLDRPGPRYTSYPTADRFGEAFGPDDHAWALARRASGATVGDAPPLSVYVHIPFCESVCYYCACNKVITRHHGRAAEYLEDVLRRDPEAAGAHYPLGLAYQGLGDSKKAEAQLRQRKNHEILPADPLIVDLEELLTVRRPTNREAFER